MIPFTSDVIAVLKEMKQRLRSLLKNSTHLDEDEVETLKDCLFVELLFTNRYDFDKVIM